METLRSLLGSSKCWLLCRGLGAQPGNEVGRGGAWPHSLQEQWTGQAWGQQPGSVNTSDSLACWVCVQGPYRAIKGDLSPVMPLLASLRCRLISGSLLNLVACTVFFLPCPICSHLFLHSECSFPVFYRLLKEKNQDGVAASQRNRLPASCPCYETKASLNHQQALGCEVRLEFSDSEIYESLLTCLWMLPSWPYVESNTTGAILSSCYFSYTFLSIWTSQVTAFHQNCEFPPQFISERCIFV